MRRSAPGSSPASQSTWKPLQMPTTRPPRSAWRRTGRHDRRAAGDGPAAQVVAVGEATGQQHGVGARGQLGVGVPRLDGVGAEALDRPRRAVVIERARKADHGHRRHPDLHRVVLDQGVGEQLLAHRPRLAGRVVAVDRQLDALADAHLADAGEPELRQGAGHGLALRVEDPLLGHDGHDHLRHSLTSVMRWCASMYRARVPSTTSAGSSGGGEE